MPGSSGGRKGKGTAILLLNMGGPQTTAGVNAFLRRLFEDADLIPLGPWQKTLGRFIARRRTRKIEEHYAEIGGGSPIRRISQRQADLTCEMLDKANPQTAPHRPYLAFRYADPLTEETLTQMTQDGVERVVAFSQYPQYSCSTTGSSLNELWRKVVSMGLEKKIQWSVIDRWPTHPLFVDVLVKKIRTSLALVPEEARDKAIILFSAHSLPMSVVNRGDPYPPEVGATVYAVMERMGWSNPYRLVWQSQVGPSAWLGPQTQVSVEKLKARGTKHAVLVPVAFTTDHIETLHELDLEIIRDVGWPGLLRTESLNDDPDFVQTMVSLVKEHLDSEDLCSRQMMLRCPGCTNVVCQQSKEYFGNQQVQ